MILLSPRFIIFIFSIYCVSINASEAKMKIKKYTDFTISCHIYDQSVGSKGDHIIIEEPLGSSGYGSTRNLGDYSISLLNDTRAIDIEDGKPSIELKILKNNRILNMTILDLETYHKFSVHGYSHLPGNSIIEYFCKNKESF